MRSKRIRTVVALLFACLAAVFAFFALPAVKAPEQPATGQVEESFTEETEKTHPEQEPEILTETSEEIPAFPAEETDETSSSFEKTPLMKGIDVSKWQGKPDWKKLAADGVEFAMIRIGFHGTSGSFGEDATADYNLRGADENGILTGVYFYSLAKNTEEAVTEAEWVLDRISRYAVSLPVVIDYEMKDNDLALTAGERTEIALAFLNRVEQEGYDGMLYVPLEELEDPALWDKERLIAEAMVWVAQYDHSDTATHPDGKTEYAMWQYSCTGKKDGIQGNVDLNYAYFNTERTEPKKP